MRKLVILKIIFTLYILLPIGCEKEAKEVFKPEFKNIDYNFSLYMNGSKCAYDTSTRTFYFPVASETVHEYITLVNYSYTVKALYLKGGKLVNRSYNNLGNIHTNIPYLLQVEFDTDVTADYELIFVTSPIIQIFTDSEIVDEPKKPGKILINNPYYQNDNESGREKESLIGIEIRGNIFLGRPKSSYGLEIWRNQSGEKNKDFSILGLREDDDWILDGMFGDLMRMRNRIAFDIWNKIARLYYSDKEPDAICGIRGKFVEVFVNDEYQGIYCLNEEVDRKQLKLKRFADIPRGLLYKGEDWGDGVTSFYNCKDTAADIIWEGWEQKYPKPHEQSLWAPLYDFTKFVVESDNNEFENDVNKYIDIDNAIDYFIFINYIRATDNMGKNTYLARYDTNNAFFLVPWDMDWSFGRHADTIAIDHFGISYNNLFERLLSVNPDDFRSKLKQRWELLKTNELALADVISCFEEYKNMHLNSGAIERENKRWADAGINLESEFILIKNWLEKRFDYLDNYFNDL